jgi:aminopeptidase N
MCQSSRVATLFLGVTAFLLALGTLAAAFARPIVFPPLPSGVQEVRDEADVAPYLAAWKANALQRARAVARPATANQQQYDARWYGLNLTFTPATSTVSGTVTVVATVVSGPLTSLDLDLAANMTVDAVAVVNPIEALATTFSRSGDVLTVALERPYTAGQRVSVAVTYHGNPTAAGYFGFQTVNSRQLIWSLSEAYGARTWWPCKDAPEDKADSVEVRFTMASGLTAVSNGTLASRTVNGANATTVWRERYPIATYLVSIAAYPYTVTTDWYRPSPTDSMPIQFNNYPESVAGAAAVQAKVKDMIAAFAARYGEYPFLAERYGHAQFQFGGGMEHQTCTSLGVFDQWVVAHELAHQWWGDLVTCRDFHHIWVNEGFATYGEALWAEATGGDSAYHADINLNRYFGSGSIYVPDATDENRVFDSNLSYNKGSWVLHMLRHVLGDTVFFQALRQYGTTWGYQSATTEDFRDVCEAVSGRNLDDFFQQWIYGEYYPVYRPAWTAASAGGGWDVTLTLQQTQTLTGTVFHMPVDVAITTASGTTTFVVEDSLASQVFVLHVTDQPTRLAIDPDDWILKAVDLVVTAPQFDRSLLVVNGVDWATYGTEITTAYTDQALSGGYSLDFWDAFAAPAGGYPAALPAPLGHGEVPPDVLGHYRNVIWVGNNYNGDLLAWTDSPMLSYLRAGGNVLLMSRQGDQFLGDSLRTYLGVNWTSTGVTLLDCLPTRPGLVSVAPLGSQSLCAVFDTVRTTAESQLLFRVSSGFSPSRGIGAIRMPAGGAGPRAAGGRFAFLSGRPYRWNHAQLKNDVAAILANYFREPLGSAGIANGPPAPVFAFESAWPNPSRGTTTLRFSLACAGRTRLDVIDVAGRHARTLLDGVLGAGPHEYAWDGRDDRGAPAPVGLYWARVQSNGASAVRRLVRVH